MAKWRNGEYRENVARRNNQWRSAKIGERQWLISLWRIGNSWRHRNESNVAGNGVAKYGINNVEMA
jgi:hypothetical protein